MNRILLVSERANALRALEDVCGDGDQETEAVVIGGEGALDSPVDFDGDLRWADVGEAPAENFSAGLASVIEESGVDLVVGVATPAVRAAFGRAAADMGAVLVSNVVSIEANGDCKRVLRSVYSDFFEESEAKGTVLALVNPIDVSGGDGTAHRLDAERVELEADGSLKVTGFEEVAASSIESAERVVSCGYGANNADAFEAAEGLAKALGAEMGGSMHFVEDTDFMPGARYVGISGARIAPKLYVALGISGSAQHLIGIKNAGTVVVVNNDPKARFFDHADYGIVGDIEEIVPAITRALG